MPSGFLLRDYPCFLDHHDENCAPLSLLIGCLEKKGPCRKNKEQNMDTWKSPRNVGAHHRLVALLKRAQNCRAYPGL